MPWIVKLKNIFFVLIKVMQTAFIVLEALRRGAKRIETRAATEKYRRIRAGDTLVFVCGENKFERRVKKISLFRSINAMLRKYRVKDIMPDRFSQKELENAYNSYTGYKDKIQQLGLVAFEIR